MWIRLWSLGLLLAGLACWCGAGAAQNGDKQELPPHMVDLPADQPLDKLLEHVRKTGLRVEDRRRDRTPVIVKGGLKGATFWQAVDAIAKQANLRVNLYQPDGVVALVEGPYRQVPSNYSGPFRTALKRLTVIDDLESGQRTCVLSMDLAWEPGLHPIRVGVGPAEAEFGTRQAVARAKIPGGESFSVIDQPAVEVELRCPCPHRADQALELLKGHFTVIVPTKMLTFTFDKLKPEAPPVKETKESVSVRVEDIKVDGDDWTVDVKIDNPPGGPKFESYQLAAGASWISYNSIALIKKTINGKVTQRLRAAPEDFEDVKLTSAHAHLRYHFTKKANPGVKFGEVGDWRLVYRTPGRMVELKVPYGFKGVPLP